MRIRKPARIAVTVAATPLMIILYLNIEKLAESRGWDGLLKTALEGHMPAVLSFALQPWVGLIALSVVSVTIGLWIDSLLRAFDANQPTKKEYVKDLASKAFRLYDRLERYTGGDNLSLPPDMPADIQSLYISMKKVGYQTPKIITTNESEYAQAHYSYLVSMYPLMRDGHLKESFAKDKQICEAIIDFLDQKRQTQIGAD